MQRLVELEPGEPRGNGRVHAEMRWEWNVRFYAAGRRGHHVLDNESRQRHIAEHSALPGGGLRGAE